MIFLTEYVQQTIDCVINEPPKKKRNRNNSLAFRVTDAERELIDRRMEQTGIKSRRAYLLKMAVDGRVINVELESVQEMVRLLSNVANNINQIARRVNETGNIYRSDIEDIQAKQEEIWVQQKEILRRLGDTMDSLYTKTK
jgi:uncharacterized protein (DUF1778 family)